MDSKGNIQSFETKSDAEAAGFKFLLTDAQADELRELQKEDRLAFHIVNEYASINRKTLNPIRKMQAVHLVQFTLDMLMPKDTD